MFSLSGALSEQLTIVDVGASPIDGAPPYKALHDAGVAHVVGFEPSPEWFDKLVAMEVPHATFLPHAEGDGSEGTLRICRAPGMTSMLEPNMDVLSAFQWFDTYSEVVERVPMRTVRLDDVPE